MLSKREQGEQNRKNVRRALGKRPLTVKELAEKSGVHYASVWRHVNALVASGEAFKEGTRQGATFRRM